MHTWRSPTILKGFWKEDFDRQTEFAEAESIGIDFAANRVTIDGQAHFSASSMVFARHAFHLALLMSSLEKDYFRYPRLLILDGIEDGGMEPERSYNFQRIIAKSSVNSTVAHQIIMTTMSVCPELDDEKYIVGRNLRMARNRLHWRQVSPQASEVRGLHWTR